MSDNDTVKIAYHPSGEQIFFREEEHVYETERCKEFVSATSFIKVYFPEFDMATVSARYAKKHNMLQADVIQMWEDKKDKACRLGTNVHYYCEMLMENKPVPEPFDDNEKVLFKTGSDAVERLCKKFEKVGTEIIVFSNKYKIAGMIDLLMRDPANGDLLILDWKTNAKITTENRWQSGLGPIQHLQDTSYNHYALQLSLYKRILIEEGYFPDSNNIRMGIIHLTAEKPVWMKVYPLDYEIDALLDERLEVIGQAPVACGE